MKTMTKIAGTSLAALLFIGSVEASNTLGADSKAPEGVLSKEEYALGSYCHQKLPAISESTLAGDHPVVSQADIIDFYGPCNESPAGKDQVISQRLRSSDRRSH
jgi:hypothetical protein